MISSAGSWRGPVKVVKLALCLLSTTSRRLIVALCTYEVSYRRKIKLKIGPGGIYLALVSANVNQHCAVTKVHTVGEDEKISLIT